MIRLTSPSTPAQYAPPCLPSRVSASTHCSANARFGERGEIGRVTGERFAHAIGRARPRDRVGATDRREEIPPRQPAVVAEQPRLRAQVAPKARQRRDDRVGHRVERGPVDVVRAQRGLEVVGEAAPAVQHAELALGAVERGRERHRDRRPRLELALVRGAPARRVGMRREPARERHRHPLGLAVGTRSSTVSCDEISPCSRCHASDPDGASSPASDSSCSLIWSSAPSAALRNANACSAAAGLRAMSASTSSAASHAPSRFPSGASGAARVCSST